MFNRFLVTCVLVGLGSAPALAQTGIDWPTFAGSPQRNGYNASERVLSVSTVPALKLHWSARVGGGAYYQPTLMRNIVTSEGTVDLLFVTSGGSVEALNAATGEVVWTTAIASASQPCRAGKPMMVGAPGSIDVTTGLLYVVDGGGLLHALAVATGAEALGYPIQVIDSPSLLGGAAVSHASPTLVGSSLYITTAMQCEAVVTQSGQPVQGEVIKFDTKLLLVMARYFPLASTPQNGGGVWGPGGVAAEADGSYLWAATANALPAPQNAGNAEKIIQLDPALNQVAVNGPSLKARSDLDFGATPLLFQTTDCPPMLAAMNKAGLLVVYDRTAFSAGATQTLNVSLGGGGGQFIGMPVFDPVTNALYLGNPTDSADGVYLHGLLAFQADASCQLSLLWRQEAAVVPKKASHPAIPAVVADGVVWFVAGLEGRASAFDALTGHPLWDSGSAIEGPMKAPPLVVNGLAYFIGAHRIYAYGL